MGYYIQTPQNKFKAIYLHKTYDAKLISAPLSFSDVPEGMALLCVVDNGAFDSVAFCYSKEEFEEFKTSDGRFKIWILMDLDTVKKLSGFEER